MSYHVKTTLCHNDIRYIVAVLIDTPTNLTRVPVQQLLAQVPMTSVPTKIYRSKVTNNLMAMPLILNVVVVAKHLWLYVSTKGFFFVKFNVHIVLYSEPRC